jgi:hypothetical protein
MFEGELLMSISAKIREFLAKHPEAGPTEVSNELAKKDVKASPSLVAAVKKKLNEGGAATATVTRGPKKGSKRGPKASDAGQASFSPEQVTLLTATIGSTRQLVALTGSVEAARKVLEIIAASDPATLTACLNLSEAFVAPLAVPAAVEEAPAPVAVAVVNSGPKPAKTKPRGHEDGEAG